MTIPRLASRTTTHLVAGARRLAGPRLHELGLKRPLIVTDKGLAELPLIAELKADLEAARLDVAVFGGVFGNPSASQVMNGAAAYRKHKADCVVGVAGGPAPNVGRTSRVLCTHPAA